MYAVYDRNTNLWMNITYSKGSMSWAATPKVYEDLQTIKKSFAGFRSWGKRYSGNKEKFDQYYKENVSIVRVSLQVQEVIT